MIYPVCEGRLCNKIFVSIAVSFIAEKRNLYVKYEIQDELLKLGISVFVGENKYSEIQHLNNDNYFSMLNHESITTGFHTDKSYFQSEPISNLIYTYLQSNNSRINIVKSNPFAERYNSNNDLFIHIRLSDAAKWNPGLSYYMNAISQLSGDNIYICSDEPKHEIIQEICKAHSIAKVLLLDEIQTLQFGSTCKTIILSHGSFSAMIGYLAFSSEVYYPEHGKIWYDTGMFSIPTWKSLKTTAL